MNLKGSSMPRNCDLDNEVEIGEMVRRFYSAVAQDDLLGHIFNDVAHVDWTTHIPKIKDFWCKILLGIEGYEGNPIEAHAIIHSKEPFTHEHFRRWLEIFQETVDLGWEGPYAQEIKRKAVKVALVHSRLLTGKPLDVLLHVEETYKD
ncbi:MAG: group III truncated hemoglobin [Acidimicrobiia bacterium]